MCQECVSAFLLGSQLALHGRGATVAAAGDAGVCLLCCFPHGAGVVCVVPLGDRVRCTLWAWALGLHYWGRMGSHPSRRFRCTLSPRLWAWAQGLWHHSGSASQLGRVRGAETRVAAAGEFPKQLLSASFFSFPFWKIPPAQACCSIQGPGLSPSPILQPDWGQSGSGSIMAQFFPDCVQSLSGCTQPLCVYHFILIVPLQLQATRSLQVLLKPCLAGEGAVNPALSQEPCGRPSRRRTWGCSRLGPSAGSVDLIVLKHSPYHLVFQCSVQILVSYLHICWGTVGCSLCSSVDQLDVSPMCRGKWNPLPPILPPS